MIVHNSTASIVFRAEFRGLSGAREFHGNWVEFCQVEGEEEEEEVGGPVMSAVMHGLDHRGTTPGG